MAEWTKNQTHKSLLIHPVLAGHVEVLSRDCYLEGEQTAISLNDKALILLISIFLTSSTAVFPNSSYALPAHSLQHPEPCSVAAA